MAFSFRYFIYTNFIDPLVKGLHREVVRSVAPSDTVIDIGCGPGSLSILLSGKASHVTGIDIDDDMLKSAIREASGKGIVNLDFLNRDATNLSDYGDREFDVAVTSMTVHQFGADNAISILSEMKRIASRVVIADYNYPMPSGFSKWFAWFIEWLAGGEHYRNFRVFMQKGGLHYFTEKAGLKPVSSVVRGNGVLVVYIMS